MMSNNKQGKAIFAGGCFWGVEDLMQKEEGVISTSVGFTGGNKDNPTYKEVSAGGTGHIEAVEVVYDPEKVSYEKLTKLFFEIHDPTQVGGQGPDIGSQYESVIFYADDNQKEIAEKLIAILKEKGLNVATILEKAGTFWLAEESHQDYYIKSGKRPYCHIYTKRF